MIWRKRYRNGSARNGSTSSTSSIAPYCGPSCGRRVPGIRPTFGEGTSPTIHGDTLIVNWDQESDSFITALDAATGEDKWMQPRKEVTSWNTPIVVTGGGRTQVVVNGTTRSRSYDIATGDVLWECGGQTTNAIA